MNEVANKDSMQMQAIEHLLIDLYVERLGGYVDPSAAASHWRELLAQQGLRATMPYVSPAKADLWPDEFRSAVLSLADAIVERVRLVQSRRTEGA